MEGSMIVACWVMMQRCCSEGCSLSWKHGKVGSRSGVSFCFFEVESAVLVGAEISDGVQRCRQQGHRRAQLSSPDCLQNTVCLF